MILNYSDTGEGNTILFLHGMAGSLRYWDVYIPLLSNNHRVIAMDLLGFGHSSQSTQGYAADANCDAISATLNYLGIRGRIILVGHSMGALISLKYANLYPDAVSNLVLLGTPMYKTPLEARMDITHGSRRLRLTYYGITSHILCNTWCYYLRPFSKRLAPLYLRSLPKQVAKDSVLHSWKSYSESMLNIIENQSVEQDINKLELPVAIVYGKNESKLVINNLHSMKLKSNVKLTSMIGGHNFPLEQVRKVSEQLV